MEDYYVYLLIDPRNNEIFYVGKGKGNRYLSHLSESLDTKTNSSKYLKIQNILDSGLKVKTQLIFENLHSTEAYHLEKILIHKLGRLITKNGALTNIAYGGEWQNEGDIIRAEDFDLTAELERLNKPFIETIETICIQQSQIKIKYPIDYNIKAIEVIKKERPKGLTLKELEDKKNNIQNH